MASTLRLRQNVFLIMHTKTYFRAATSVCSQQAAELLLQEIIPFWMQGSCKRHARGAAEQATQRCLPAAQLKAVCMSARQSSAPCCQAQALVSLARSCSVGSQRMSGYPK
eukprot:5201-Heterococcus_DN1.PRE.1